MSRGRAVNALISYGTAAARLVDVALLAALAGPVIQGGFSAARSLMSIMAQPVIGAGQSVAAADSRAAGGLRRPSSKSVLTGLGLTLIWTSLAAYLVLESKLLVALLVGAAGSAHAFGTVGLRLLTTSSAQNVRSAMALPAAGAWLVSVVILGAYLLSRLAASAAAAALLAGTLLTAVLVGSALRKHSVLGESAVSASAYLRDGSLGPLLHMIVNRGDVVIVHALFGAEAAGLFGISLASAQPVVQLGSVFVEEDASGTQAPNVPALARASLAIAPLGLLGPIALLGAVRLGILSDEYNAALPAALALGLAGSLHVLQQRLSLAALALGRARLVEGSELLALVIGCALYAAVWNLRDVSTEWRVTLAAGISVLAYAARVVYISGALGPRRQPQ